MTDAGCDFQDPPAFQGEVRTERLFQWRKKAEEC